MMRIGHGLDLHRLEAGQLLWLGGLQLADADRGAVGHSDGDALLHAITDALLGAIGAGDIGDYFPPSDPQWQGASSAVFLAKALSLVDEAGFRVANVDTTIVLERPKLGPHKAAIQAQVASLMGLQTNCVGVKAKTAEGILGELGAGEAIAATATVLLMGKQSV